MTPDPQELMTLSGVRPSRSFRNSSRRTGAGLNLPSGRKFSARRGQIQGMEAMNGSQRINAFVPLAQMFGYATDLRSKTQGRGQYSMEPSHYAEVPKSIAESIIAGRKKG